MDYISVVKGDEAMHRKLELFSDKVRDGHAPFLSDMDLQAYAMAGIATDHECFRFCICDERASKWHDCTYS